MCCPNYEGSPHNRARQTKVKRSHEVVAVIAAVLAGILVLAVGYYQSANPQTPDAGSALRFDTRVEQGTSLPFNLV